MSSTSIASRIASRASRVGLAMVGRHYDRHDRHDRKHWRGRDREVHHYYHGRPRVIYRNPPPVVYHAPPRHYYGRPQLNIVLPLR